MTDMDKMMIEPCPFCGGEATVEKPGPANWRCWSVRCQNCPKPLQPLMSVSPKRAEAITAWNTRAWQPHLDYAGEQMRPGEFRDPPVTAYNPDDSREELKHDLERQMTIANIECNEVERLRVALRCAEERFHMAANAIISPDTLRRWSRECNDALNNRSALSRLPQGDG